MFAKAIVTLLLSLAATSGVSWLIALACGAGNTAENTTTVTSAPAAPAKPAPAVRTVNAYPALSFEAPVEYTHANDGTNRVFVVEQPGRIRVFTNDPNVKTAATYLDIKRNVAYGGEMGLLGLAFHPDFKKNGYFFVNYTKDNPRETVIARYKASSADAMRVDPASEVVLLRFRQPYANHNGGKLMFGPDGYLYIATGDGGSGGDPQNNGQDRTNLLGKILRIDVNKTDKGNYGIPADNPFVGNREKYREEIFAYGLRNPWRFSFDDEGRLWAGDVGQNKLEEINVVTKGGNYGWRIKEARDVFNAKGVTIPDNLISPVWQYPHDNGNVSVTGGQVYRGRQLPTLRNQYVYADYASGRVWAFSATGKPATDNRVLIDRAGTISAFGEDPQRELYLCDHAEGKILRLTN